MADNVRRGAVDANIPKKKPLTLRPEFRDMSTKPDNPASRSAVDERKHWPLTVSSPAIHFAVRQNAALEGDGRVWPPRHYCYARLPGELDCLLIAFSENHDKFLMHPLREENVLSFSTQRPLYLDRLLEPQGTTSVSQALADLFDADDQLRVHLFRPRGAYAPFKWLEHDGHKRLLEEYLDMTSKLPFTPAHVGVMVRSDQIPERPSRTNSYMLTSHGTMPGPLYHDEWHLVVPGVQPTEGAITPYEEQQQDK